jgi:hypothetical protein
MPFANVHTPGRYIDITYWTEVEITAIIVCAAIPALRAFFRWLIPKPVLDLASKLHLYISSHMPSTPTVLSFVHPPGYRPDTDKHELPLHVSGSESITLQHSTSAHEDAMSIHAMDTNSRPSTTAQLDPERHPESV